MNKLSTEIIYIMLQAVVRLLECLLEKIWKSVLTTPNVEDKIGLHEAFERNYEMKLVMKFDQCVCSSSLNLEMYFFRSRMANCFGVI